jgi:hypothetical protein
VPPAQYLLLQLLHESTTSFRAGLQVLVCSIFGAADDTGTRGTHLGAPGSFGCLAASSLPICAASAAGVGWSYTAVAGSSTPKRPASALRKSTAPASMSTHASQAVCLEVEAACLEGRHILAGRQLMTRQHASHCVFCEEGT